jgi:hypothetical protein
MIDLPNFFTLFTKVSSSLPIDELYIVFLVAISLLAVHALLILLVGKIFMTHLVDMIAWTYALIALKIFEVDTNAFYFVGEMYTTIGYGTFSLPENWKILPVMIAFSGIFAASMSGAILFNMISQIIRKKSGK